MSTILVADAPISIPQYIFSFVIFFKADETGLLKNLVRSAGASPALQQAERGC